MLVSDVITRVRGKFGDAIGVQISDADIIRWINDGVKEISYASNLNQARAVANAVAGQFDYSMPTDELTVFSVLFNGTQLKNLSLQERDQLLPNADDPTIQAVTGTPTSYWIWGEVLTLYPTPDTNGVNNIRMYYTKLQTVTLSSDTVPLPPAFDTALINYVMKEAYETDENWEAAAIKQNQFDKQVSTIQEDASFDDRDVYPSITTSARDSGDISPMIGGITYVA